MKLAPVNTINDTFVELGIEHKLLIDGFTAKFKPYSDFNSTSLLCWDVNTTTHLSMLNKNLVIEQPDYVTGAATISVLGNTRVNETIDSLLNIVPELRLVPEATAQLIDKTKYSVEEDRDNYDYVYDLQKLAMLEGGAYKKKRNKSHTVMKHFGDRLQIKHFDTMDNILVSEIRSVVVDWAKNSHQSEQETSTEIKAIDRLLLMANEIGVVTSMIYVDDNPVAFSINEILPNGFGICHFEKTIHLHPQLASVLAVEAAGLLYSKGCKFVNWEQDLGIEGLRRSKLSFSPGDYLKKYTVRRLEV